MTCTIIIERRLHDIINSVVAELLSHGGLYSYDSALAYRLPNAKHSTPVKLPWLQAYLKERFQFLELLTGKPVDMPPSLARFVMQRWQKFPEFRFVSTNPTRRRHRSALHNKETTPKAKRT
jgi:hypothetical protein